MKSILREQRRSSIVAAAVTILLGLMLVLVPNRSIRFLCGLLGTALLVTGLIYILGVVRQAAGRVPCVVSDPGASAGGAGAVAAEQSCIGDRSDPVQLCGGAAVSRGHRPSGSGESDAGGVAPVVDRSGPGRPDPWCWGAWCSSIPLALWRPLPSSSACPWCMTGSVTWC